MFSNKILLDIKLYYLIILIINMSFNTFCGQDPADPLTYNKVLAEFLPAAGGGGNPSVLTTYV